MECVREVLSLYKSQMSVSSCKTNLNPKFVNCGYSFWGLFFRLLGTCSLTSKMGYRRSVKYHTCQYKFLTYFSSVLVQFAHHIRKDIDMIGLICHLFGSQIGAVIIPSEVADSHGSIYSDLALNYTKTQRGVLLLVLENQTM